MKATIKKALFGLVLMIFTCAYAYGAGYEIYDLTPSYSTYSNSYAYDLNENNEVVGYISDSATSDTITATFDGEAFLYSEGTWTNLRSEGLYGAEGINESTQISGYGKPADAYDIHAFRYDHTSGTATDLNNLENNYLYGYAVANDINDNGAVVGFSAAPANIHAFIYEAGTMIDLTTNPSPQTPSYTPYLSQANAINNNGQVVGSVSLTNNISTDSRAFIWDATNGMTEFSDLAGKYSEAHDINYAGWVVGYSKDSPTEESHAFITLSGAGTLEVLDDLSVGGWSEAYGINDNNQVVGSSDDKAVMWQKVGGVWTVIDLNTFLPTGSLWTLVAASAINDNGSIVGWGTIDGESGYHAFLLKADMDFVVVPEPASILLLLGAVIGFMVKKARNN